MDGRSTHASPRGDHTAMRDPKRMRLHAVPAPRACRPPGGAAARAGAAALLHQEADSDAVRAACSPRGCALPTRLPAAVPACRHACLPLHKPGALYVAHPCRPPVVLALQKRHPKALVELLAAAVAEHRQWVPGQEKCVRRAAAFAAASCPVQVFLRCRLAAHASLPRGSALCFLRRALVRRLQVSHPDALAELVKAAAAEKCVHRAAAAAFGCCCSGAAAAMLHAASA